MKLFLLIAFIAGGVILFLIILRVFKKGDSSRNKVKVEDDKKKSKVPPYTEYEIRKLLLENKKTEAVKLLSEKTGMSSEESFEYITAIESSGDLLPEY